MGEARLSEGAYKHPRCSTCTERPAAKIDVGDGRVWVTRLRKCNGQLVDFSISLWLQRTDQSHEVVRWSVAHSNYHRYRWSGQSPGRKRDSFWVIDHQNDVRNAFLDAQQRAYRHTDRHIARFFDGEVA